MIKVKVLYEGNKGIAYVDPFKVSCVYSQEGYQYWYVYFNCNGSFLEYARTKTKEESEYYMNEFVKIIDKAKQEANIS